MSERVSCRRCAKEMAQKSAVKIADASHGGDHVYFYCQTCGEGEAR
jgi:RNase P subunit RPR2